MYTKNMQGSGILKRIAQRKLYRGRQFWRTSMMLQQLTIYGQMLQTNNSDQLWRNCLSASMRQPNGLGWTSLSRGLTHLPRSFVRAALWQASHDWLIKQLEAQLELYEAMIMAGMGSILLTDEDLIADHRFYQETYAKLKNLQDMRTFVQADDLDIIEIVSEDEVKRMMDEMEN